MKQSKDISWRIIYVKINELIFVSLFQCTTRLAPQALCRSQPAQCTPIFELLCRPCAAAVEFLAGTLTAFLACRNALIHHWSTYSAASCAAWGSNRRGAVRICTIVSHLSFYRTTNRYILYAIWYDGATHTWWWRHLYIYSFFDSPLQPAGMSPAGCRRWR